MPRSSTTAAASTRPLDEVVRGGARARGRPVAALGLVVGRGGGRSPRRMPGCRSRGPGTSPRPTGSSTAGGARPPASAGRPRTASRWTTVPAPPTGDLFEFAAGRAAHRRRHARRRRRAPARRPRGVAARPRATCEAWARAALETAHLQHDAAAATSVRLVGTVLSESAAAVLCLELRRDGLPIDRARTEQLSPTRPGRGRPRMPRRLASRRARDALVLRHVPGRESTDLRNPAQVREMLAAVGVDVPNTRKWVLEPYRTVHPLVDALLDWRRDERIATTYGYRWLDAHVGPDDRLRGRWTACDGAAGRMTAENGLHNLPAVLRPGVAAHPGHVFVRADLGQIEPRVLAVVSGDAAFAAATRADDLYAPVAAAAGRRAAGRQDGGARGDVRPAQRRGRRGAQGPRARLPGRDGPARPGVRRRAARRAAAHVRRAARSRPAGSSPASPVGADPALDAARGRFARNAIIQGAAAELFKAWAATVRATTRDLGGAGGAVPARRAAGARARRARRRGGGAGRPGARGRRRGGGPGAPRCGSSPTPRSSPAGPTPRTERSGRSCRGFTLKPSPPQRAWFRCEGRRVPGSGEKVCGSGLLVVGRRRAGSSRSRRRARRPRGSARPRWRAGSGAAGPRGRCRTAAPERVTTARASSLPSTSAAMACWLARARITRSSLGRLSPVTSTMALREASAPSAHSEPAR